MLQSSIHTTMYASKRPTGPPAWRPVAVPKKRPVPMTPIELPWRTYLSDRGEHFHTSDTGGQTTYQGRVEHHKEEVPPDHYNMSILHLPLQTRFEGVHWNVSLLIRRIHDLLATLRSLFEGLFWHLGEIARRGTVGEGELRAPKGPDMARASYVIFWSPIRHMYTPNWRVYQEVTRQGTTTVKNCDTGWACWWHLWEPTSRQFGSFFCKC